MNHYIYCCIAAGSLLLLNACTSSQATDSVQESARPYPVVALEQKDTVLHLSYVTAIEAQKNIELHARTSGMLQKIYVQEGQAVRKGQLLFRLNEDEARLNLDRHRAALNSALASAHIAAVELKRVRMLVEKKVVSPSELELVQARLRGEEAKAEEARAAKAEAQTLLSYTAVHAPFDGIIDRLPLKEGSLVEKGSLLTTISDIHSMYAYFDVSENEYLRLVRGDGADEPFSKASLMLSDGTTYPLQGTIMPAESEIDGATGSIAFRAVFPNPDRLLKHGASGRLLITREVEDVLLVPQKSVFEIQDKSYVYLTGKDNRVTMKSFVPAQRVGAYYIVESGLKANDRVVYEGLQSLRDGVSIRPQTVTL